MQQVRVKLCKDTVPRKVQRGVLRSRFGSRARYLVQEASVAAPRADKVPVAARKARAILRGLQRPRVEIGEHPRLNIRNSPKKLSLNFPGS